MEAHLVVYFQDATRPNLLSHFKIPKKISATITSSEQRANEPTPAESTAAVTETSSKQRTNEPTESTAGLDVVPTEQPFDSFGFYEPIIEAKK